MPKYLAKIIKREVIYIDNETGEPCLNMPSEQQRLLDAFNGNVKFTFCEIYTLLASITGNTYKQIDAAASSFAIERGIYDFDIYIIKK